MDLVQIAWTTRRPFSERPTARLLIDLWTVREQIRPGRGKGPQVNKFQPVWEEWGPLVIGVIRFDFPTCWLENNRKVNLSSWTLEKADTLFVFHGYHFPFYCSVRGGPKAVAHSQFCKRKHANGVLLAYDLQILTTREGENNVWGMSLDAN